MSNIPSETSGGGDPLASLHKMSRTAGLGTTEYVEVNPTAVVALLLGLASGLAVLGSILLIVPVVALVVALVALRQINRSAGTQTGKGIAILGMVLALLCVGVVGGREVLHARQVAKERDAILAQVDTLGKDLNEAKYDAAWSAFSPRFKERMKKEEFADYWGRAQAGPLGQIKAVRSNGIVDVRTDDETGEPYAQGIILFDFAGSNPDHPARREARFRKDPQQGWVIDDIEGMVTPQPRMPQRAPQ